MPTIVIYLATALAVTIGGWLGVKSLKERGAAEVRAQVEARASEATIEAHEHRIRAQHVLEAEQRDEAAKVAAMETELEKLRHERASDTDGGAIVFDQRWAGWVRGDADRPRD